MFGLPSFESIVVNLGTMIERGPLGAVVSGANDMNQSAAAVAAGLGEQSPDSIAARNRIKDLTDNHFEGEFHNSRIPGSLFGNVRAEDLDELYRKAQSIDVGVMTTLQQMWKFRADKLGTGLAQFGPEILSAISESWSGAASRAAAQGIVDYVNKAQNMVSATKMVADKVEIVTSAVELTKINVQPKPDTGWASTVAGWVPGPTWKMDRNRTEAAELATYTILEQVYQPGIREGDTAQPRIPLAYNPVHDPGGVPSARLPTSGVQPAPSQGGQPSGTSDYDGSGAPQESEEPGATAPADESPLAALANQSGLGSADTTAAGLETMPTSTSPAGLSSDTSTGTGPGSTGSGLGNAAPGGQGGAVPGGPGRSIPGPGPGVSGLGSGVVGAGSDGGSATARSGMGGMGGMSPGARGKGDDDKEKGKSAVAEAMVTREHGEELTGMDAKHRPKSTPPVLGE